MPTEWTDDEVHFVASRGTFARGALAYLYIIDPTGGVHGPSAVVVD